MTMTHGDLVKLVKKLEKRVEELEREKRARESLKEAIADINSL